jgi:outer membrane protein OmpA-like peptidoglycan-associated protein
MNIESLNKILHRSEETEEHWISLSDVMAGLMMVFLLIAIVYMLKVQSIAKDLKLIEVDLHNELEKEFKDDFKKWNAVLDVLTIRFREPRLLFIGGKDELRFQFKRILNEFIPRYIKIINKKKYREKISEIRIEGHTSSDFFKLSPQEAYLENMKLSQRRAENTLVYILKYLPEIKKHKKWFRKLVAVIGLSSSRLIKTPNGTENIKQSRRVEFRILLNTDEVLSKISSL